MPAERLQKILAQAGIASRRKAEALIQEGAVTVNGQIAQLGSKADLQLDHIKVRGKLISRRRQKIYLLLNKPAGFVCTVQDPENRPTVMQLVPSYKGLFPVGRLDYHTEGLLLLTNDGTFAHLVSRAGERCPKLYEVKVRGIPAAAQLQHLRQGMQLPDGTALAPMKIRALPRDQQDRNAWFQVALQEGRNRQIRRTFDALGHPVMKLRRVAIGFLRDRRLKKGESRHLSAEEISRFQGLAASAGSSKPRRPVSGAQED